MEKDSKIYKGKKERVKSIALKAKKESSDDKTSTSGSDDEEYVMAVRNIKKLFRRKGRFVRQLREEKKSFQKKDDKQGKSGRKCYRFGDSNHLIRECPKPPQNRYQKAFSWSDSENEVEDKTNDEMCLMAQSSNEVCLRIGLEPDEWIKDSGCSKHMTGNKSLFLTYKAYDRGNVVFGSNLKGKITGKDTVSNDSLTISNVEHVEDGSEITKDGKIIAPRTLQSNGVVERKNRTLQEMSRTMLNEQSIPQKFCHPPTKLSPLVDDDVGEEEAIENNIKVVNNNNIEDGSIEVDDVVNIKESKSHPLEQVIGNLNQRMLRSQAQNKSNSFCFISTIEPKNVNEALGDESWVVAMQEELNQFVVNDV
ncbi:retrovirus-related pol polyprotein from transposon TNT 1-94 [Tanacetum coccineum]